MRLHESARPYRAELAALRDEYLNAPDDALLTRKVVAAGTNRSLSFYEKLASSGGGPAFLKVGPKSVLYRKGDVVAWFAGYVRRITSTSELPPRTSSERQDAIGMSNAAVTPAQRVVPPLEAPARSLQAGGGRAA
jgi:hypothetical protein